MPWTHRRLNLVSNQAILFDFTVFLALIAPQSSPETACTLKNIQKVNSLLQNGLYRKRLIAFLPIVSNALACNDLYISYSWGSGSLR